MPRAANFYFAEKVFQKCATLIDLVKLPIITQPTLFTKSKDHQINIWKVSLTFDLKNNCFSDRFKLGSSKV